MMINTNEKQHLIYKCKNGLSITVDLPWDANGEMFTDAFHLILKAATFTDFTIYDIVENWHETLKTEREFLQNRELESETFKKIINND